MFLFCATFVFDISEYVASGSVSFLSQFRWLDKWQFCFGNPALLSVRSDGGHTFLSEDIAVQLCQPYVEHLHVLMKSFADHSWQYSCLINELSIALRDGCLGLVSAADRDSSYATQRCVFLLNFCLYSVCPSERAETH